MRLANRHAQVVDVRLTAATGLVERKATVSIVEAIPDRHPVEQQEQAPFDVGQQVMLPSRLQAAQTMNTRRRGDILDGEPRFVVGAAFRAAPFLWKRAILSSSNA